MKISVVVVTFNSSAFIQKCLDSVLAQKKDEIEVIAVDNGSRDSTVDLIKKYYPQVRLICNDDNTGAACARNQAISQATGEWVLTLDSDASLSEDFLARFSRFLDSLETGARAGIIVPKILYPDGQKLYSLGHCLTPLRRFYDIGKGLTDEGQFENLKEVFGACSAVALYRRQMLAEIKEGSGYFDEDFFFMAEDVDLAWRARKKGWTVDVCQDCLGYHAGDGSGTSELKKIYYSVRNRFLMIFKNESRWYLMMFAFPLILYEFFRWFSFFLKRRGGIYCAAFTSAAEAIKARCRLREEQR